MIGYVNVPDGTVVTHVSADSFAGGGTPYCGLVVFGSGEEKVAFAVELDAG